MKNKMSDMKKRIFDSGATRDVCEGKLDFEGFLSPLVLESYAQYMNKHRLEKDGVIRDSDNWQKLFGTQHKDVCMKSAWRHFMSWWTLHRGYKTEDDIESSICALIFNASAYLHKILLEKNVKSK